MVLREHVTEKSDLRKHLRSGAHFHWFRYIGDHPLFGSDYRCRCGTHRTVQ